MRASSENDWPVTRFVRARVNRASPEDLLVAESLRLIHREIRSIRVQQLLKCLKTAAKKSGRDARRRAGGS